MQTVTESPAFTFSFSAEERDLLKSVLQQALHDKQIEERRTDSITFREIVYRQEALLESLIDKLSQP